ncbi:hypothetical protein GUJ93_ZPchr0009g1488 [Zizania palustris]|uniref:Uncharacterized protein n=1 Tax=Zizania palustris TaxID=103762 RepID=A0A8J5RSD9_ZIZPA|nr:hypothetical protein GUJ93_ZPchr0009g1488 [Zizania palustris]
MEVLLRRRAAEGGKVEGGKKCHLPNYLVEICEHPEYYHEALIDNQIFQKHSSFSSTFISIPWRKSPVRTHHRNELSGNAHPTYDHQTIMSPANFDSLELDMVDVPAFDLSNAKEQRQDSTPFMQATIPGLPRGKSETAVQVVFRGFLALLKLNLFCLLHPENAIMDSVKANSS